MEIMSGIGYFVLFYPVLMVSVWIIGGLIFRMRWEDSRQSGFRSPPPVTILVPAHNEEGVIREMIHRLSELTYPNYEVVVVNDGSTDGTAAILDRLAAKYAGWLRVLHLKTNVGKARALNRAIEYSRAEFIVTIDADCILEKDALQFFVGHLLSSKRVGAVTGNARVRNRTTLLGKIQVGEYSFVIGMIKRAQRIYGRVLTVSGAITAYRKRALLAVGCFDPDTVTEDIDVTWKLHEKFWEIRYEPRALCWVLVPETIKGLWGQRVRWAQGGIEVIRKHFRVMLNARYRRLWPVYIEYVTGIVWAHLFISISVFLIACNLAEYFNEIWPIPATVNAMGITANALMPDWAGTRALLAFLCLGQFTVSFILDARYEKRIAFRKPYFWVVWYPAIYWLINTLACISAVFRLFTRRSKICAVWKSPDRGIHTLR